MSPIPQFLQYIPRVILTLAHLAGLIVAIMLLMRKKGTPAILATVAFGLAFVMDIGQMLQNLAIAPMLFRQLGYDSGTYALFGLNCCCGLFDLIAVACLIVALWQALAHKEEPVL